MHAGSIDGIHGGRGCKLKLPSAVYHDSMWDLQMRWLMHALACLQLVLQLDRSYRSYSGHINKGHCIVRRCFLERPACCSRSLASFGMDRSRADACCAMWSVPFLPIRRGAGLPLWSATFFFFSTLLHYIFFSFDFFSPAFQVHVVEREREMRSTCCWFASCPLVIIYFCFSSFVCFSPLRLVV